MLYLYTKGNSLIHGKKHLKIPFKNLFLKMEVITMELDQDGVPWVSLAIALLVNNEVYL